MQPPVDHIHWLGHDSFRIDGQEAVIYIDPWRLQGGPAADLILITHDHHDHCSPEDIAKIRKADTVILTTQEAADKLPTPVQVIRPGEQQVVKGVTVRAVPAYNTNKFRSPGQHFHPREKNHVGFVVTVDGTIIYHTGDADPIPEMTGLKVDVALLPVSGTYVMTVEEAVQAAQMIQPKVAIPMHVGAGIGTTEMAEEFRAQAAAVLPGLTVVVLPLEGR